MILESCGHYNAAHRDDSRAGARTRTDHSSGGGAPAPGRHRSGPRGRHDPDDPGPHAGLRAQGRAVQRSARPRVDDDPALPDALGDAPLRADVRPAGRPRRRPAADPRRFARRQRLVPVHARRLAHGPRAGAVPRHHLVERRRRVVRGVPAGDLGDWRVDGRAERARAPAPRRDRRPGGGDPRRSQPPRRHPRAVLVPGQRRAAADAGRHPVDADPPERLLHDRRPGWSGRLRPLPGAAVDGPARGGLRAGRDLSLGAGAAGPVPLHGRAGDAGCVRRAAHVQHLRRSTRLGAAADARPVGDGLHERREVPARRWPTCWSRCCRR